MKITKDWIIMFCGALIAFIGAGFAGNEYQFAPTIHKIGFAVSIVGLSVVGFATGMGRDRNGNLLKTSEE